MTMTTSVLDPWVVIEDPVLVADDARCRDPEVPQRARRRTFTAKYKLEVLDAYVAAYDSERCAGDCPRCYAARACTPVTSWSGAEPVMSGRSLG
jgi:hypothetical protein